MSFDTTCVLLAEVDEEHVGAIEDWKRSDELRARVVSPPLGNTAHTCLYVFSVVGVSANIRRKYEPVLKDFLRLLEDLDDRTTPGTTALALAFGGDAESPWVSYYRPRFAAREYGDREDPFGEVLDLDKVHEAHAWGRPYEFERRLDKPDH